MKKLFSLILIGFLTTFSLVNIHAVTFIYISESSGEISKIDTSSGAVLDSVTIDSSYLDQIETDASNNVYGIKRTPGDVIQKYDSDLNFEWSTSFHTANVFEIVVDDIGNVYSAGDDNTVRKMDTNGNQLWSFTGHTSAVTSITIDDNGNVYTASTDNTIRKLNSNGQQQWVVNAGNFFQGLQVDSNGNIYGHQESFVIKISNSGSILWTYDFLTNEGFILDRYQGVIFEDQYYVSANDFNTNDNYIYTFNPSNGNAIAFYQEEYIGDFLDTYQLVVDLSGNFYLAGRNGNDFNIDVIDSTGTYQYDIDVDSNLQGMTLPYESPEPDTYEVNLSNNASPYIDFVYEDNDQVITNSSINTVIENDESWSITNTGINFGPFSFNFWYDLDNDQVFSNDFAIDIGDPSRDYNLAANFSLNNASSLELDSNLPTPPNFELIVDTILNNTASIITYPINEQIPNNFDYQVLAPTTSIGFYEFDYWYDNDNDEVFSNNVLLTGAGLENRNLTATYSLPEEYQINLTLESSVGFITFQHGDFDPITGESISVTIGQGDQWSATAPQNPDFQFNRWRDLDTLQDFSNNREIVITNTTKNYNLRAYYLELVEITWDSNGGTPIPNQKVIIGSTVQPPNDPIRPGFVFNRWEDNLGNEVIFPKNISEDVTFTADWIETFTLTYDTNGGGKIDPDTYIENAIPEVVTPSRFGYEFTGWFTDDGTFQNAYDFTDPITQDTTIHARWAFGSDRDAQLSLTTFLDDNDLGDGFSQIVIMITIYIFVNIIILIYQAPLIVTLILNFIVTSLFMILGWIAIWLVVVIFMALFGLLYFFSSGRGITE